MLMQNAICGMWLAALDVELLWKRHAVQWKAPPHASTASRRCPIGAPSVVTISLRRVISTCHASKPLSWMADLTKQNPSFAHLALKLLKIRLLIQIAIPMKKSFSYCADLAANDAFLRDHVAPQSFEWCSLSALHLYERYWLNLIAISS